MIKVKIKNFQSIGSTEFKIDGFTVIVGKNNIGKSAVIRAIDAAMSNQAGNAFIRKGTKSTEVTLETKNLKVEWKKGDKSTYMVNGESFTSLNRSVPKPILDAGFKKIEIGDLKVGPLIAHQFEPLFIIDKPGSVATEVLSSIYKMDVFSTADDLCQKELRSIKSLAKTRETDKKDADAQIEKYKDFETIKEDVKGLYKVDAACKKLKDEIADIDRLMQELEKTARSVESLKSILKISIPSSSAPDQMIVDLQWVQSKTTDLTALSRSVTVLGAIQDVKLPDCPDMRSQIDTMDLINRWNIDLKNSATLVKEEQRVHGLLNDTVPGMITQLDSARQLNETLNNIGALELGFRPLVESVRSGKTELDLTEASLVPLMDQYNKIEICPFCNRPKNS